MPCKITGVDKKTPALKAGLYPGLSLVSINGHKILDVLDYRFYETDPSLSLVLTDETGEELRLCIEKELYEPLGLVFETYLMDHPKSCRNKCLFCFIDQLPPGMRETLYFKDDDLRLSFLTGNYVTLTNVSPTDIDRVLSQRISPINISVHTTNPALRERMLKNPRAGDILPIMERLSMGHVQMNCQIVLCRGVNDGEELKKTLRDLTEMYPGVLSLSVVPAGLTRHRQGLYPLSDFTKEEALRVIEMVEQAGMECIRKYGSRIVYLADEFYIKASLPFPEAFYYEDFPQIENGVGLMRSFMDEFTEALLHFKGPPLHLSPKGASIATGKAAAPYIRALVDELRKKCNNYPVTVYEIENRFLGETITVSGLLCGQDIVGQLINKDLGERLFISSSMLRHGEETLLDGMTVSEISQRLHVPVIPVANSGDDLFDCLMKKG